MTCRIGDASPAEPFRPGDGGEARIGLLRLPRLAERHSIGAEIAKPQHWPRPALAFRIGVQEPARLGAERGFIRCIFEVHPHLLCRVAHFQQFDQPVLPPGCSPKRQRELL
jgi:hypothetical protein